MPMAYFRINQDPTDHKWYWTLRTFSGRDIAKSPTGYDSVKSCYSALSALQL